METVEIQKMIARYGLVSDQVEPKELTVILQELVKTLQSVQGAVVEFGCYRGTTSLYIRRILNLLGIKTDFHVYDSFAGLPEKAAQDASPVGEQFVAGELRVSKKDFISQFRKAGLKLPTIHKGWFSDLTSADIPDQVAFAYLDGDYYESIKDSLRSIEARLLQGATLVVDDYANEALPGVAKAVDEWAKTRSINVQSNHSLAILRV